MWCSSPFSPQLALIADDSSLEGSLWFHVEAFLLSWQLTPPVTQPQLQTGTLSRMTCQNLNKTLLLILYKVCQSNRGDITTAAVHAKSRDCRDPEISFIWFVVWLPALVDPCQIMGSDKVALVEDKLIRSDKAESYHTPCPLRIVAGAICVYALSPLSSAVFLNSRCNANLVLAGPTVFVCVWFRVHLADFPCFFLSLSLSPKIHTQRHSVRNDGHPEKYTGIRKLPK